MSPAMAHQHVDVEELCQRATQLIYDHKVSLPARRYALPCVATRDLQAAVLWSVV